MGFGRKINGTMEEGRTDMFGIIERVMIGYLIVINLAAFSMFGIDKRRAIAAQWRIPEKTLLFTALAGGSVGAFLGMRIFHHKTKHWKFLIGVPFCILLHIGLAVLYWWCFVL